MRATPRIPSNGDSITIGWARDIAKFMRTNRIISGQGFDVAYGPNGVRIDAERRQQIGNVGAQKPKPFQLRWCRYSENKGQWQIYYPIGSATLQSMNDGHNYICTNNRAKNQEEEDIVGWYEIGEPDNDGNADFVVNDNFIAKVWPVYALMKPYPRLKFATDPESFDTVLWKESIGAIGYVEYKDTKIPYAINYISEAITKTYDSTSPFSIVYDFDKNLPLEEPRISITNGIMLVGRQMLSIPECDDDGRGKKQIDGWKNVWVKIAHSTEEFSLSIEKDLKGEEAISDDDKTVVRIYDIADGVVVVDNRPLLDKLNLLFYTNSESPDNGPESGNTAT